MGIQIIEAEAKFVDQIIAKGMDFAGREAIGCVVAVSVLKAAAIKDILEGRRLEVTVIAVAVADEGVVFLAEGVVAANIELVLGFSALGVGKKRLQAEARVIGCGK